MSGKTLKQFELDKFYVALEAYKKALQTGAGVIEASLRVHMAKANVPMSLWPLVNRAFRTGGKE